MTSPENVAGSLKCPMYPLSPIHTMTEVSLVVDDLFSLTCLDTCITFNT